MFEVLTFTYRYTNNGNVLFTLETDFAKAVVHDIRSVCGSRLKRDEDCVTFLVEENQVEDAIQELEDTDCSVGEAYSAEEE